ncbi:MAG TPA: hypothetical protein VNY27_11950 [Solirubrobacteraceae bacterium]|jgi:hypothetical protein|nr:hypothetical protein [Solirubrobacteraceae bacterium]
MADIQRDRFPTTIAEISAALLLDAWLAPQLSSGLTGPMFA